MKRVLVELRLDDQAIGDFRVLNVEPTALQQSGLRRNNDVLWIERRERG